MTHPYVCVFTEGEAFRFSHPPSTEALFVCLYIVIEAIDISDLTKLQPSHVGDLRLRCFGRAWEGEVHAGITTCRIASMSLGRRCVARFVLFLLFLFCGSVPPNIEQVTFYSN